LLSGWFVLFQVKKEVGVAADWMKGAENFFEDFELWRNDDKREAQIVKHW
jgi:hypothetical protein